MAELLQDAALAEAAALLLVPAAATLLLELSLAQPARPALAASTAIAAIAATVICLIPASSSLPARSENYYPERAGACLPAPDCTRVVTPRPLRPGPRLPPPPAPA